MPFGADCGPTAQPPLPADPGWEVQPKASTPAHVLRPVRPAQVGHLASLELALRPKTRHVTPQSKTKQLAWKLTSRDSCGAGYAQ